MVMTPNKAQQGQAHPWHNYLLPDRMNPNVQKSIPCTQCTVTPATWRAPKIDKNVLFWEKATLNRKSEMIHVFLPSFTEISKAEVTKTMHGNLQKKG